MVHKLKRCGTMDQLVILVKEAFKIHYNAYNTKTVKKHHLTMDCRIPNRSGNNIASKLSLVYNNGNNNKYRRRNND